jgi:hypothetical protein
MQEAPQYVLEYEGAEVTDVREGVHRGPAGINTHFALVERLQGLDAIRQRVVEHYRRHFWALYKAVILSEHSVPGKRCGKIIECQ